MRKADRRARKDAMAAVAVVLIFSLAFLAGGGQFSATARVSFSGMTNSFTHGSPTATVSFAQGKPAFGRLQPVEPLVIGPPQTVCQSRASVMFLGVNLGQDKAFAQQLYPQVTIELYLDGNLQGSQRGPLEKFVDTTSPSTSWWYQFIEFIFYPQNALSLGAHTASSIVKFNAVPIFTGSDTFTVLNC